jgi:SAM-dependent methyltransferase
MMRLAEEVRSFKRRRIDIPVGPDDLVLDVGSGDKPHWRADVLVDAYAAAEFSSQRSGGPAARVTHPLFDADAATMPFANGVFDYSICSHVLEHVPHPGAVITELTRVSKGGYIEVPEASSAKIVDFPSHLWWCRLEGPTLVFSAKHRPYFDAEIDAYLDRSGTRAQIRSILDSRFEHRVICLSWQGSVDHRVEGAVDDALLERALGDAGHHQRGRALSSRALTAVMSAPVRGRRRRAPVRFDDVVAEEHRTGTGELLAARIYKVG